MLEVIVGSGSGGGGCGVLLWFVKVDFSGCDDHISSLNLAKHIPSRASDSGHDMPHKSSERRCLEGGSGGGRGGDGP